MTPFDPTAPIEPGVTVLEASAGTGKTYAVASVVVGEVAAGRPLEDILVVTFTIKATSTLRERVWERLKEACAATEPGAAPAGDPLLAFLQAGRAEEVSVRHERLRKAVAGFDAATIDTIHGFCQDVLRGLGVAGDGEPDLELVEDIEDLVRDAVDDLFVRRFHDGNEVLFQRDEAALIAKAVIDNPTAEIGPYDSASPAAKLRAVFAKNLRKRVDEQKRRRRLVTYDDLLTRLVTSIDDGERGAVVVERLNARFHVVIVDEFQDTDDVQWRIFDKAFGAGRSRLVLVGDPKQSIYAFRGGDVQAYLEATAGATTTRVLACSYRSDPGLVAGLNAVFAGAALGDDEVRHVDVEARPGATDRLVDPTGGAPLLLRVVQDDRPGRYRYKNDARDVIAADVAAYARRLLDDGATIEGRPVRPGDIAVLVRTRAATAQLRAALHAAGVPAVVHGGASVFTTRTARDVLDLLRALEAPARTSHVRAVALGPFVGWTAAELAAASDERWDDVEGWIHEWAAALRWQGVASLQRELERDTGLTARLLGEVGGERRLGDVRHLFELLHAEHAARPSTAGTLVRWLTDRIAEARADDEGQRRLESDADAVTIQTVHSAKGLEFPIVLLPSLWEAKWIPNDVVPVFHDPATKRRTLGVGRAGDLHQEHLRRFREEAEGEELRFLYVALTRARHRAVAWWATERDAGRSPLARILLQRTPGVAQIPDQVPGKRPGSAEIEAVAGDLWFTTGGAVAAEPVRPVVLAPRVVDGPVPDLAVARFDRSLDERWTRTSYTALTRAAHDAGHAGGGVGVAGLAPAGSPEKVEVDERAKTDEVAPEPAVAAAPPDVDDRLASPLPLGPLPGGARFGTLVHEILERVDFAADDVAAQLGTAARERGGERLVPGQVDALVAGLVAVLDTPLGPLFDGRRLRDLGPGERLDELGFDLPLAGGDEPDGDSAVAMAAVADVFEQHLPVDDPLAAYHERLRDPLLDARVRGYLSGSIDLVARLDGRRHVVVDYKTNALAPRGVELTAWHYRPAALVPAMQDADYPLQAALYAVALHRYLRWRQPGYDPDVHLGGVAYLFVRGMSGPDTPLVDGHPCGVFAWRPPSAFVLALSDLLDAGVPA